MTFHGPKTYLIDGITENEMIVLTCESQPIAIQGTNHAGTFITYHGPDTRLARLGDHAEELALSEIGPIVREWGYAYDADRANTNTMAPLP
jgi:hypothetical protein